MHIISGGRVKSGPPERKLARYPQFLFFLKGIMIVHELKIEI